MNTQPPTPMNEPKLASTHPSFREEIGALSANSGLTPDEVFALWRKYSRQCEFADQSALLWEFKQWYAVELSGKAKVPR